MSIARHVLGGSTVLALANGIARFAGILVMPLLTAWLSPAAYGQATLASTLISLATVVGLMGMDMSYARSYLSRTPPNGAPVERFFWRSALAAALLAGLMATCAWILHVHVDLAARSVLSVWIMLGTAGSLVLVMAQTRARLQGCHGRMALSAAMGGIGAAATSLSLAWLGVRDERALVSGYVVAYLIPILVMGIPGWKELAKRSGLDFSTCRQIFLVGLPGVVTAPMYWILTSSDRWFLQAYTDSATVGIYAIACTFGQLGMMATTAIVAVWVPEATRLHESGDAESDRVLAVLMTRLILLLACAWLGIAWFGGDALRWFTAEKFHGAAWAVPWLATAVFAYGCYHLANTGLFLGRQLGYSALLWGGAGLAAMVANLAFIPRFGAVAAAIVQCCSFSAIAIAVMRVAQRQHPLPLPFFRLLAGVVLCAASIVLASGLPETRDPAALTVKAMLLFATMALVAQVVEPGLTLRIWRHFVAQMRTGLRP